MSHGVVTGTGAVCPLGRSPDEFYRRLLAGESAIRPMTAEERLGLQATHVARYDAFTPQPEIPAMKARRFDRGSQFAILACGQAIAEARLDISAMPEAVGIAMGTGSAGAGALTEFLRVLFVESPEAAPPFHFPNTVANAPASQVSIELKLFGPNVTITQKDPSGLNALLYAALAIETGRARAMIAGAVDEWNAVYAMGFDKVSALRGERRSSGIVQGEGAFAILLEPEAEAAARGVRPLARLSGIAAAGIPSEPYRFAPDPASIGRAIRRALEDAERLPRRHRPLAAFAKRRRRDGPGGSADRGGDFRNAAASDPGQRRHRRDGRGRRRADGRRLPRDRRSGRPVRRRRPPSSKSPGELLRRGRQFHGGDFRGGRVTRARPEPPPLVGFAIDVPVRFAECDSYGVVWHGHYALYIEQAREALTSRYGFTAAKALAMGYKVPITRMEIRYRLPILADATVRVAARLRPPDVARLIMDYEIRSEAGQLLASAETEQVILNAESELLFSLPRDLDKIVRQIVHDQDRLPHAAKPASRE